MMILPRPAFLRRLKWLMSCRFSGWCSRRLVPFSKIISTTASSCNCYLWKLFFACILFVCFFIYGLWFLIKDPCETSLATQQLCEDFKHGYAAGSLCYDFCVTKSLNLPKCLSKSNNIMTFHSKELVVKFKLPPSGGTFSDSDQFNIPFRLKHLEGRLSNEDFHDLLVRFLRSKLGSVDINSLVDRLYQFADVNHDGKLNFGEACSLWELIHIHEFFILFIFQGEQTFPAINGTCGSLYIYDRAFIPALYDKANQGFLNRFFSNTYRWNLPNWYKRVNIVVGLLENVDALSEQENAEFHMCNIGPTKLGYTDKFEAKLTHFEDIITQHSLDTEVRGKLCYRDGDCAVGDCVTGCDVSSRICTSQLINPTLVHVCKIIEEYLLFDAPTDVKTPLKFLIAQCLSIDKNKKDPINVTQNNLLLDDLTKLLWDQIKSKPVSWLDLTKKKARTG